MPPSPPATQVVELPCFDGGTKRGEARQTHPASFWRRKSWRGEHREEIAENSAVDQAHLHGSVATMLTITGWLLTALAAGEKGTIQRAVRLDKQEEGRLVDRRRDAWPGRSLASPFPSPWGCDWVAGPADCKRAAPPRLRALPLAHARARVKNKALRPHPPEHPFWARACWRVSVRHL